jgi:hypothetical protein
MQDEVDTSMYDTPAGNAKCTLSTSSLLIEFVLFHWFIPKFQTLDVMTMHMMRKKKQVPTICMASLKVASKENMTRRNGKASQSHLLQDHMIWQLIHLMDTAPLGHNKMY